MNKNNAAQYIPLVQALADGKEIEVRSADGMWDTVRHGEVVFSLDPERYRVKPEPRKFYLAISRTGHVFFGRDNKEAALKVAQQLTPPLEIVEVVETGAMF